MTVGLAQFSELTWVRRKLDSFKLSGGMLVPRTWAGGEALPSSVYLPYSAGLLQAYAEHHAPVPERFEFLPMLYKRLPVEEALEALDGAHVVGFSTYVWNIRLSLEIARALKQRDPGVLIVFGGPQVPDQAEAFLAQWPFVDVAVHGEGESVFLDILESSEERDWTGIPSISYVDGDGAFVNHPRAQRMRELGEVPSPYLTGVFDEIMAAHPEIGWLGTWETNRGCPFSCSFCDWGSAVAAKVNRFPMERLAAEADWFATRRLRHLFLVDANFGILRRDVDIARTLVDAYERHGARAAVSVQSAKNTAERTFQLQSILASSRAILFVGATMALQSVTNASLEAVKRKNISLDDYRELQRRYRSAGIPTYTDLILGLPRETYESFADGLSKILGEGHHNRAAIYNCSVLPNAEMGDPEYLARYGIQSVPVPIVHEHESVDSEPYEREYLETVIATAAMDREDWVRTRVLASMCELLHFDRLLHIPFVVLAEHLKLPYRLLIETVLEADSDEFPVCAGLRQDCADRARAIQRGECEHIPSEEYLRIWWPVHQYCLVRLVMEGLLDAFYDEVGTILGRLLDARGHGEAVGLLEDALELNHAMLRVPNAMTDVRLTLSANVLDFYRGEVEGRPVPLRNQSTVHEVARTSAIWLTSEAWAEEVVLTLYNPSLLLYPATSHAQHATLGRLAIPAMG